jgi:hypothetical protein
MSRFTSRRKTHSLNNWEFLESQEHRKIEGADK